MWDIPNAGYNDKLRILEAHSTVLIGLLLEDATLVALIKRGESQEACLKYINENF